MVSLVSFAFTSALIFKISFLLLTLGFFISSFFSCFRCRVRLFIWLVSVTGFFNLAGTDIFFFFATMFLNRRIIALQNFVVFCQTSTRISHRCIQSPPSRTYFPSASPSHPSISSQSPCWFLMVVNISVFLYEHIYTLIHWILTIILWSRYSYPNM